MTGKYDVTCTQEAGESIARELGGEHVVLSGVGHLPMVEDPALVVRHLAPHLENADERTS